MHPYRKWCGYDCPHQEYDILSPSEFEVKMKKEEDYWLSVAKNCGVEEKAGLWYAPWIHEEIVEETDDALDSIFFLLMMDEAAKPTLYVYYQHYTKNGGTIPCMMTISDADTRYQFSVNKPSSLWDNEQWSKAYSLEKLPTEFQSKELEQMKECAERVKLRVDEIISQ